MGWRFVKQPNGLYARFSEVIDDFTHTDLTRQQALEVYEGIALEQVRKDAKVKVLAADQNLPRWEEALEIVGRVHGKPKALHLRKEGKAKR